MKKRITEEASILDCIPTSTSRLNQKMFVFSLASFTHLLVLDFFYYQKWISFFFFFFFFLTCTFSTFCKQDKKELPE